MPDAAEERVQNILARLIKGLSGPSSETMVRELCLFVMDSLLFNQGYTLVIMVLMISPCSSLRSTASMIWWQDWHRSVWSEVVDSVIQVHFVIACVCDFILERACHPSSVLSGHGLAPVCLDLVNQKYLSITIPIKAFVLQDGTFFHLCWDNSIPVHTSVYVRWNGHSWAWLHSEGYYCRGMYNAIIFSIFYKNSYIYT